MVEISLLIHQMILLYFRFKRRIEAANVFVDLYKNHSAPGVVNFNEEDAKTAMQQGRGAMWIDALAWVGTVGDSKNSKVSDRIGYALPPGGPKGKFPQVTYGFQIPEAAKRKDLSWEFIKWALSKKMMKKIPMILHIRQLQEQAFLKVVSTGLNINGGVPILEHCIKKY